MGCKQDRWYGIRKHLGLYDKNEFKDLYLQQPVVSGFDLAAPNSEFTVRWNKDKGYYERQLAGETHWERCG